MGWDGMGWDWMYVMCNVICVCMCVSLILFTYNVCDFFPGAYIKAHLSRESVCVCVYQLPGGADIV